MLLSLIVVVLLYFNNDFACVGPNSDQVSTMNHFQINFKLQRSKACVGAKLVKSVG